MNLPPLPALPVLPPLPLLPPILSLKNLTADQIEELDLLQDLYPIGGDQKMIARMSGALPAPVVEEYKRTVWFPLTITPFHAGKYEVGFETDAGTAAAHPDRYLWDGREWADKLPSHATGWRGWDRSRWVAHRSENPPLPGWYPMRFPRADKKAPSYWDGVQWMYANPTTGEMLAYAAGPKWQAEWFHDGAP